MISRNIRSWELGMRPLKTISTCLLALALHSAAWAEIYETTDAQGNPEFTDSPPRPNAEAIDLPQTNIIDAPPAESQEVAAPQTVVDEQAPAQENRTVIIHDGNNNEDEVYDDYLRRERAFDRMDPAAPDEVLDGEAPREVGDSDAQMPREVGDSDAQMPREVEDSDAQMPREERDLSAEERNSSAEERGMYRQ
jgi:hypothetical protein